MNSDSLIKELNSNNNPERIDFVRNNLGISLKDHEIMPDFDRMVNFRYKRLQEQIIANDCVGVLLCNSMNIRYATGTRYAQISNMHSPTRYVFVPAEGSAIFFISKMYNFGKKPNFIKEYREALVSAYFIAGESYIEISQKWAKEISEIVKSYGSNSKRLALDYGEPEFILNLHKEGLEILNADKIVEKAGSIKCQEELFCIAFSVSIAESGLSRVRENLKAGISEQELWAYLAYENARKGGEWFEYNMLVSGGRTNPWGQESSDKLIRAGELIGIDTGMIGPFGYSADLSRTFFCRPGLPSSEQKRLYKIAVENLNYNKELIKIGMSFREFSEMSWKVPEEFWNRRYNSIAHGVGMGNEWPHIPFITDWTNNKTEDVFEENMVLAIESCIGREDGAECVKLEDMIVIKNGKCQYLSTFPLEEDLMI